MDEKTLCRAAIDAMQQAYAPYSHCTVGAALLTADGRVYTGCNIENAAYPATVCAERVALFKAVSEGEQHFAALAVAGGRHGRLQGVYPPCGVCRQVLAEFCPPELPVLTVTGGESFERHTLGELLPLAFSGRCME